MCGGVRSLPPPPAGRRITVIIRGLGWGVGAVRTIVNMILTVILLLARGSDPPPPPPHTISDALCPSSHLADRRVRTVQTTPTALAKSKLRRIYTSFPALARSPTTLTVIVLVGGRPVPNKPYGFCGRKAPCLLLVVGHSSGAV